MNLRKNLNDIPIQFRQYENTDTSEKSTFNENISTNDLKSAAKNQSTQTCLNTKDRIFIFLILAIFFEAL